MWTVATRLPPEGSSYELPPSRLEKRLNRRVDCGRAFIIPRAEQVSVDFQCNRGRRVPKASADCHHVDPGVDEMRGMRVPKRVERDLGNADARRHVRPFLRERARRLGLAVEPRKDESVIRQLAEAKRHSELELLAP